MAKSVLKYWSQVEQQHFPPPLHPPRDLRTRKPYPSEVKQLNQVPGNPVPLKQHGPFQIQPLHVRGLMTPTTTVSPALVSSLPPRRIDGPDFGQKHQRQYHSAQSIGHSQVTLTPLRSQRSFRLGSWNKTSLNILLLGRFEASGK